MVKPLLSILRKNALWYVSVSTAAHRSIPQQLADATTKTVVDIDRIDSSVCKVFEAMKLSTQSQ